MSPAAGNAATIISISLAITFLLFALHLVWPVLKKALVLAFLTLGLAGCIFAMILLVTFAGAVSIAGAVILALFWIGKKAYAFGSRQR